MGSYLPLALGLVGEIPPGLIVPFGLLLALIAVMPLTPPKVKHVWEHYYPHIAIGLGLLVVAVYLVKLPGGGAMVGHTLQEYFSFICLIGSLYVVAGGIHLKVKGEATPLENVVFLAIGAVAANVIGTTGASMVLIRPWIRTNKIRISAYPYRLLHFHRVQLRRRAHADRRSAAVPRLPARRAVLLAH